MTIQYLDSKRIQGIRGEEYYEETDANSGASMSNGGVYYAYGTEIRAGNSAIGKQANKWTIQFGRNNSPQGVVEAHIYTGTEGATSKTHSQTSTNSVTVDNISTSNLDYSFTFATPHTITAGDVIALVWKTDTSSSASNYVNVRLFNALTDMPNTRNYMVSTSNWDGSDDDNHTWSVAPSPYTTYTLTSKLELTDDKPTNVQDNSILVEKDTANRFWFTAPEDFDFSASSSGAVSNQPTDATEVGQLITSTTHRGKKAKSATFYVKRTGSPSGTMVYKIRKSSDNSVVATSTGTSASALSTSTTAVTLDFNDEVIPSENVRVTVSGVTGSSGNIVTIYGGGADTVADQRLTVWGGSSWTEYDNDCAGKLTFTESWTMQPTKQFDFSSSTGWTTVGSNITITGGAITASAMVTQTDNRIYYDLGSALSDKFVIDFDHYADSSPANSFWQMFALTDTTAIPRTDDGIYPLIDMGSWDTYLRYSNEGSETNVGTLGSLTTGQWQYVRFVRDGTTGTLTVYSNSARTIQVLNVSGTIPATVTGLRYFQSGALASANTGTATYKIDNLKIYDGVTSVN